jgi:proteasome lid subunit RPN8/RPN11
MHPSVSLELKSEHWNQMLDHVCKLVPEEACGLIAGLENAGCEVIPITNTLKSPLRYRMHPQEQLEAFNYIEAHGWELLGIYHSHPAGPAIPSLTDVEEAAYPGVIHLIWSRFSDIWQCRGFIIQEDQVQEVVLEINRQAT